VSRQISNFDIILFLVTILLVSIGIILLYSVGFNKDSLSTLYINQFIRAVIGLILMFLVFPISLKKINAYSLHLYFITAFFLLLTLIFGKEVNGTKAWLSIGPINLQFSEFAKIATILVLAKYLDYHYKEIDTITDFVVPFLIIIFPIFLILLEPDLGSTLVLFPILFAMLYLADANVKNITAFITIGIISVILPLFISYYQFTSSSELPLWMRLITNKTILFSIVGLFLIIVFILKIIYLLYKHITLLNTLSNILLIIVVSLFFSFTIQHSLKPYQKKRLLVFVNPKIDPYGSGYNIIQSKITIGSGEFNGKGYLKGPQTQLGFLPEQQTDFIISVAGEEFGWVGMMGIYILYFILILRGLKITYTARTVYAALIACGITTMFIFQVFINIGMTIGLMPVTGIPLPFLSYGGSSLIASMIAVGLLLNISSQRYG